MAKKTKEIIKELNLKLINDKYLNKTKKEKIKELRRRIKEHIIDDKCLIIMISQNKKGFLESSYFNGFSMNEMEKMIKKVLYESIDNCKLNSDKNDNF